MSEARIVYQDHSVTLAHGDCLEWFPTLDAASVDAICTDPPAGIAFMGQSWDGNRGGRDRWIEWLTEIMRECLRVTKPGGHALVWALPRTAHWTATAIEDAGWEIEEKIVHLFGSGFPKGRHKLKPAAEDWILARKGIGPLQIDACRLGADASSLRVRHNGVSGGSGAWRMNKRPADAGGASGRWPSNAVFSHSPECEEVGTRRVKAGGGTNGHRAPNRVYGGGLGTTPSDTRWNHADPDGYETVTAWECAPDCAVALLDAQSGVLQSGDNAVRRREGYFFEHGGLGKPGDVQTTYGDRGGASRFFYTSKASKSERGPDNDHPTVKPLALIRWLMRLVTPPGGLVCDPFFGSGTGAVAARLEGFRFIGCELLEKHCEIARGRLAQQTLPFALEAPPDAP